MNWVTEVEDGSSLFVFIILVILAAIPGIPFGIVGSVIGAKYGLIWGSIMNIAGSSLAAALVYTFTRYLFQSWGRELLTKSGAIERCNLFINSHLFWSILIARMIPIFPAAVINIYAGVFRIRFKTFFIATLIGKLPVMISFAYIGDNMISGSQQWVTFLIIYLIFLLIVYMCYKWYMSRLTAR
ncbi:TVP38/TMEM64 family protein [Paenibacillus selenitireducens]|nr:TVP38/TMEM64 family protein [Paenibacillus selenitireducens]